MDQCDMHTITIGISVDYNGKHCYYNQDRIEYRIGGVSLEGLTTATDVNHMACMPRLCAKILS